MRNKTEDKKVALVTGGNKGIGLEICRQLAKKGVHVILTSRTKSKGLSAIKELNKKGLEADFELLDASDKKSIKKAVSSIKKKFGKIDILINNAGILIDTKENKSESIFDTKIETIKKTMDTNTFGPILLCQEVIPIMKKNKYGRIVNLSSGMGQLKDMYGGYPGYRLSKVSLNAVTKIFADELEGTNILINTMCPGWVRTDMGGKNATRSVEKGAETTVWLALLPNNGPSGKYYRDKKVIPW